MSEIVYAVLDYEDLIGIASSEEDARSLAEQACSISIDKHHYGSTAEKRFRWDGDSMEVFAPTKHPFYGLIEWINTGLCVTPYRIGELRR